MKPLSILLLLLVAGCTEKQEDPKPGETWRYCHNDGRYYDDYLECKILQINKGWVQYCEKHLFDSQIQSLPIEDFKEDRKNYDSPFLHDTITKCDNP
jgi:hypothetical protein